LFLRFVSAGSSGACAFPTGISYKRTAPPERIIHAVNEETICKKFPQNFKLVMADELMSKGTCSVSEAVVDVSNR
jgi:hypothetical protein